MHITKKNLSDTKVQLIITAEPQELEAAKQEALQALARTTKVQGFRPGKAPLHLIEKQADAAVLQADVLDRCMNRLYAAAVRQEKLRPVDSPNADVVKFVPYTTLELKIEVAVIGEVKLPAYKTMKFPKPKVSVAAKEVDDVLDSLRTRESQKNDVARAAAQGDQAWLDFTGVDSKTKEPTKGADGKDYPLVLGSNTFIPGFEDNVVGLKAGDQKTFTVTFPKDYGVKALQSRKVDFTVTLNKVQEVVLPKLDDAFAAKAGPFKTLADLKADIKKELQARKEDEAEQQYADEVLRKVTEKAKVVAPDVLVDEQVQRIEQSARQNASYRGQTWQEYLKAEGLTEETYRKKVRPEAELRVKAGLVLAEIAEAEDVTVTPEEFQAYFASLKQRYPDKQMQAELAKPEAEREITGRMLTQKTLKLLTGYTSR